MDESVVCLALMTMASVAYIACNHHSTLRVHRSRYLTNVADRLFNQLPVPKKPLSAAARHCVQVTNSANTPLEPENLEALPAKRLHQTNSRVTHKPQQPKLRMKPQWDFLPTEASKPTEVHNASTLHEPQIFFAEGVRLPPPRIGVAQSDRRSTPLLVASPVSIPYVLPAGF